MTSKELEQFNKLCDEHYGYLKQKMYEEFGAAIIRNADMNDFEAIFRAAMSWALNFGNLLPK